MKNVFRFIALLLMVSTMACTRNEVQDDYIVCAYVWPSCHDDSLAREWLWPDGEG